MRRARRSCSTSTTPATRRRPGTLAVLPPTDSNVTGGVFANCLYTQPPGNATGPPWGTLQQHRRRVQDHRRVESGRRTTTASGSRWEIPIPADLHVQHRRPARVLDQAAVRRTRSGTSVSDTTTWSAYILGDPSASSSSSRRACQWGCAVVRRLRPVPLTVDGEGRRHLPVVRAGRRPRPRPHGRQRSPADADDDEDLPPIPWHLWLLAGALAVYLGYRAVQGIEWLIGALIVH